MSGLATQPGLFSFKLVPYLSAATLAKAKGVYSTRKLVSDYNGYAMEVVRESDSATMNATFDSSGGLNAASVISWLGGSKGRISIWYDQSGNGYDLTQTTANSRPTFQTNGRSQELGGVLPRKVEYGPGGGPAYMDFPAGLSTSPKDVSIIQVYRADDYDHNAAPPMFPTLQLGTESNTGFIVYNSTFSTQSPTPSQGDRMRRIAGGFGGAFRNSGSSDFKECNCNLNIQTVSLRTSESSFALNGRSTTAGGGNSFSGTGGTWGQSFGTSFTSQFCEAHSLIVASAYTANEEETARNELMNAFSLSTPANLLVWDGDSISSGYTNATANDARFNSPAYLLRTNLGNDWDIHNRAWAGGNTTSGQAKDRVSPAVDGIDPIFNASYYTGRQICVIFVGTNDIALGTATATIQSRIQEYCDDRQTAGWEVIVCNIIPRQSFTTGQETSRQAINSWLDSNYDSFADHLADMDGAVDWTDSSYATYLPDGTHPNELGVSIIESTIRDIIN